MQKHILMHQIKNAFVMISIKMHLVCSLIMKFKIKIVSLMVPYEMIEVFHYVRTLSLEFYTFRQLLAKNLLLHQMKLSQSNYLIQGHLIKILTKLFNCKKLFN